MRRRTYFIAFVVSIFVNLFLCSSVVFAQNELEMALVKEGISLKEFEKFTTYYYQNPDPEKLTAILKAYLAQEKLMGDKIHSMPFIHLIATAAHNDSSLLSNLKTIESDYSGLAKEFIAEIIYQAENFNSPKPISAFHLDYLWAEFLATGDEKPVKKIISVLDYQETEKGKKLTEEDVNKALTFGAARWSLGSNAQQHEKVYKLIRKEAILGSGRLKKELDAIIANVEAEQTNQ